MSAQSNNESEPLLSPTSRNQKVWYKTASPYWLIPAYMIMTITDGLSVTAKVKFYLRIVCYDYYSRKGQIPPDDNPDEWCNNADVQSATSRFLMILELCIAIPAILTIGPLGSLSDRKGRKIILLISTMGTILNILNILLVGNFLETVGLYSLLIGSLIKGFAGGTLLLSTASYAYATDCTFSPTQRSVVFGWIQGSYFLGVALGPMMGGWIVKITNNLFSVFYITFVIFVIMFLFFLFILPESLTKEKLSENLSLQQENLNLSSNRSWFLNNALFSLIYSIFKPLTIFLPSNSIIDYNDKINTKYSLLILLIVDILLSTAIMGIREIILLYINLVFKWSLVEQGYFLFIMGISRVLLLFILFPMVVLNIKKHILFKNVKNDDDDGVNNEQIVVEDDEKSRKEFIFEVWVLRFTLLIDSLAFIGYGLATSGLMLIGAAITASIGTIATPTIKSLLTNLVSPSQIGQLLGALSVLNSIIHIISPILFNTLYSILVKTSPNLIWYVIATLIATASLFSFGVA